MSSSPANQSDSSNHGALSPQQPPVTGPPRASRDPLLSLSEPTSHTQSPHPFADSHFFDDAFRQTPTPPLANFLDTILNPAQLDHGRYSPFDYRPSTHRQPVASTDDMPPVTRPRLNASQRPARLPNGYVDLTSVPDTPPQPRRRESPSPGPSAKRRKRDHGTDRKRESPEPVAIEEVDLTDEKLSIQDTLQKQRQDAVKSQTKPEEQPTTFNTFTCVICMDNPTDLTATACGRSPVLHIGQPKLTKRRPSLLSHLPHGGSYRWRESDRPWRAKTLTMPRLSKEHKPLESKRHNSFIVEKRHAHTASEKGVCSNDRRSDQGIVTCTWIFLVFFVILVLSVSVEEMY